MQLHMQWQSSLQELQQQSSIKRRKNTKRKNEVSVFDTSFLMKDERSFYESGRRNGN